jgi:hypothetical protein
VDACTGETVYSNAFSGSASASRVYDSFRANVTGVSDRPTAATLLPSSNVVDKETLPIAVKDAVSYWIYKFDEYVLLP